MFNAVVQAWRPQLWPDEPNIEHKIAVSRRMGHFGASRGQL
ncbi:hypothetical protein [Agrobacterium tumefaciens]|nr:hypothetical protein [Agrobacterium tumefaciens]